MRLFRIFPAAMITAGALGVSLGCSNADTIKPLDVALHDGAEAMSLLGEPLVPTALSDSTRVLYEQNWTEARAVVDSAPNDADAIIWLGRRTAYLGRYREAIDVFTQGIERHPDDARMYRHRGHRYITTRQLNLAEQDFNRAIELIVGRQDEIEPDGLPNARNQPTTTLQFNVWYHSALTRYLQGNFEGAREHFEQALLVSRNPDSQVASRYWLYMTLRRLQQTQGASELLSAITADMDIIENASYHRLLLMYKGEVTADSLLTPSPGGDAVSDATTLYGVANWHLYNGRSAQANTLFQRILQGNAWAAFGFLAAEAEVARTR